MSSSSLSIRQFVLDTSNWPEFRLCIRAHALTLNALDILDGKEAEPEASDTTRLASYRERCNKLWMVIVSSLDLGNLVHLRSLIEGDIKGAYDTLKKLYEPSSEVSMMRHLHHLLNCRPGDRSLRDYVSAMRELRTTTVRLIGSLKPEELIDKLTIMTLLMNLPQTPRFEALKSSMDLNSKLTLDLCCETILRECEYLDTLSRLESLSTPSSATALQTRTSSKSSNKSKVCTHCKKKGHQVDECYALHPELQSKKSSSGKDSKKKQAAKVTSESSSTATAQAWSVHVKPPSAHTAIANAHSSTASDVITMEVDSGASDHFVTSPRGLSNFDPHYRVTVQVADDREIITQGRGDILGKLKGLHVAPTFSNNLLSVPKLCSEKKAVVFHPDHGVVISEAKDVQISWKAKIATGQLGPNGTYNIQVRIPPTASSQVHTVSTPSAQPSSVASASPAANTSPSSPRGPRVSQDTALQGLPSAETVLRSKANLWFRRLGYASPNRILLAMKHKLFVGPTFPVQTPHDFFGAANDDAYNLARSKAAPHINLSGKKSSSRPFELLHMDIKDSTHTSYGGHRYFAVVVDDYTRWKSVLPLKKKSDLVSALRDWYPTTVSSHGFKTSRIRCDRGGEQTGGEFKSFLREISARVEYTNAHSSASNGVAERAIRTLMDTARALRIGACLPKAAWAECIATACYLENRLPTTANPDMHSPYHRLFGMPPDLNHLRAIGAKAYVHQHTPTTATLDPKAKAGIIVGYAINSPGYRVLMDIKTGVVVETKHVVVSEQLPHVPDQRLVSTPGGLNATYAMAPAPLRSPVRAPGSATSSLFNPTPPEIYPTQQVPSLPPTAPAPAAPQPAAAAGEEPADDDAIIVPQGLFEHLAPELLADFAPPVPDEQGDGNVVLRRSSRTTSGVAPERLSQTMEGRQPTARRAPARPRTAHRVHIVNMSPMSHLRAMASRISYKQAVKNPLLRHSMLEELVHLFEIGAVRVTALPPGRHAIGSVWAHKFKHDADGQFTRAKSRLCPMGCDQTPGVDYDPDRVAAPTLTMESAQLMNSCQVQRDMEAAQVDVVKAFTLPQSSIKTYMRLPRGLISDDPNLVLAVENSLNGLKQSAYDWNTLLVATLRSCGLRPTILDPCLFFMWIDDQYLVLVGIYVDDVRILADRASDIKPIVDKLAAAFPITTPSPDWWLGMKVEHDRPAGTLHISQCAYIDAVLKDFGMQDCAPVSTPALPGSKLTPNRDPTLVDRSGFDYRAAIGSLLWLARLSRPDILYAVNQLGAHAQYPTIEHVTAAKRVLRYLKGTRELGLTLRKSDTFELEAYVDADFAGEPETSATPLRSLTGMVAYIRGVGPIYAKSSLQSTLSTSTADAEYKAIATAAQFCSGIRQLLEEIGFKQESPSVIYNDNEAAIASTKSMICGSKLRHVRINFHYVKEQVRMGEIKVQHCPTKEMVADIFTKALPQPRFLELREKLMSGL
jgi:hypothetical protein